MSGGKSLPPARAEEEEGTSYARSTRRASRVMGTSIFCRLRRESRRMREEGRRSTDGWRGCLGWARRGSREGGLLNRMLTASGTLCAFDELLSADIRLERLLAGPETPAVRRTGGGGCLPRSLTNSLRSSLRQARRCCSRPSNSIAGTCSLCPLRVDSIAAAARLARTLLLAASVRRCLFSHSLSLSLSGLPRSMVQPTRTLTLPSLRDLGLLDVQPAPDPTASSSSSKSAHPPPAHNSGPPSRDPLQYSSPLLKALRASHHPNVPVPAPRNGQQPSNSLPSPYSRIEAYVGPRSPRETLAYEGRMHPYRRLASLPSVPPEFAFPTSTTKRRCASLPEDRRGSLPPENVRREMYFPTSGQRSTIGAVAGGAGLNGGRRAVEEESCVVAQPAASSHVQPVTSGPRQHAEEAGPNVDDALLVPWQPLATPSNPAPVPTHIRLPLDLLHSTLLSLTSKGGKGRPGEDQAVEDLLRAVESRMERSRGGRSDLRRRSSAGVSTLFSVSLACLLKVRAVVASSH